MKIGNPPAEAKAGTKLARGANFRCLLSGVAIAPAYIKAEAMAGRMSAKLMAIVVEGIRSRVYLTPTSEQEQTAQSADAKDAAAAIHVPLANDPRNLWCLKYGLDHFDSLFTPRQLVALTTFSDLVGEARERIQADAIVARLADDDQPLDIGGTGAKAYAEAVSVYLAFASNKCADYGCSIATWMPRGTVGHAFSKQAIPMTWDFPEANLMANFHCALVEAIDWVALTVETIANTEFGYVEQVTATTQPLSSGKFISTDPPYYDNIGYCNLSIASWPKTILMPIRSSVCIGLINAAGTLANLATPIHWLGRRVQALKASSNRVSSPLPEETYVCIVGRITRTLGSHRKTFDYRFGKSCII